MISNSIRFLGNFIESANIAVVFRMSPVDLFPILTLLLQSSIPAWFHSPISTHLSLLPLRPGGVRQMIEFLAAGARQGQSEQADSLPDHNAASCGAKLPLEVLDQASKILSSVPSSLNADEYFSNLGPQLLQLLDENIPDSQRAAAYIIGNGILGRRKYGSPGTIGWDIFAQPIIDSLNPSTEQNTGRDASCLIKVSEESLEKALNRLSLLVTLHPNPGLTKRLVTPLMFPLWGLLCYSEHSKLIASVQRIHQILVNFFKSSAGIEKLIRLCSGLLWDGPSSWTYRLGLAGGVEIRDRLPENGAQLDAVAIGQNIESRVHEYIMLIRSGAVDEDEICIIFVHVIKICLLKQGMEHEGNLQLADELKNDPLHMLVYAKLMQRMLENCKDLFAAKPMRIVDLVDQLLAGFITDHGDSNNQRQKRLTPSLSTLGDIVEFDSMNRNRDRDSSDYSRHIEEESIEMLSVAMSLLSAILSSQNSSSDRKNTSSFNSLHTNLLRLASFGNPLPSSLVVSARQILAILDFQKSLAISADKPLAQSSNPYASDIKSYGLVTNYLVDPLPPVRAQGLAMLTALITKKSPVLDIPSITILLQSLLQDEDEFIYLSVIKALSLLASQHSKTVIKMLLERYVDANETATLDTRIRMGEALLQTIQTLSSALVGVVATLVGESMISVASRRMQKPKTKQSRELEIQKEAMSQKESEEAWGGFIPQHDVSNLLSQESRTQAQILAAWASPTLSDDPRIRASALSILGTCVETNISGLGTSLVSTSIDLALSVLKFEPSAELAVLRRAAVLLIGSLVTALERAADEGRTLEFELADENTGDVIDVLRLVEEKEGDEIVRGHLGVVIARLDEWRRISWKEKLGAGAGEIRFGLEGGLRGLSVGDCVETKKRAGIIEEIE